MKAVRFFAVLMFFTLAMSLNSFGYSILCQGSPHSGTFSNVNAAMFTCAIAANAVPVGKSIRVTVAMHSTSSGDLTSGVYFNGSEALDVGIASTENIEQGYNFIITNIGSTSWWVSGQDFYGGITSNIFGPQDKLSGVTVPWSSGWTLAIEVSSEGGTITASGDTFIVELLD